MALDWGEQVSVLALRIFLTVRQKWNDKLCRRLHAVFSVDSLLERQKQPPVL